MDEELVKDYQDNPEHYESLDKRSKEYKGYKAWKANYDNQTSTGLGDVIEKVTTATGIKKAVKFIAGEDCGCSKRKEKFNKIRFRFPVVRCFTEDQYNDWTEFVERTKKGEEWIGVTPNDQIEIMIPIYKELFARQIKKPLTCCLDPYLNEINRVYEQYQ